MTISTYKQVMNNFPTSAGNKVVVIMGEFFKKERFVDGGTRAELLKTAVDEIKINTCKLTHRQLEKIFAVGEKLRWRRMHHLDATDTFLRRGGEGAAIAWEWSVVGPSVRILSEFLGGEEGQMGSKSGFRLPPHCPSKSIALAN